MTDSAPRRVPGPYPDEEMEHFLATYMYEPDAFFVDEVVSIDREKREIVARMDTRRPLPITALQRADDSGHPAHVSAPELLILTGNMGCLHAWFIHGCRWNQGWVGFGNRIHRADFKALARLGPPLDLRSTETRTRVGENRVVLRYEFHFEQDGELVYYGDQSAQFFRDRSLAGGDAQ